VPVVLVAIEPGTRVECAGDADEIVDLGVADDIGIVDAAEADDAGEDSPGLRFWLEFSIQVVFPEQL